VFGHVSILNQVNNVESDEVVTGICNMIGNKGGIGISFNIGHNSILFINCHLASGQHSVKKRNQDFYNIETKMKLPK